MSSFGSHGTLDAGGEGNETTSEATEVTPEVTDMKESGFLANWRERVETGIQAGKVVAVGAGIAGQLLTSPVPADHHVPTDILNPTSFETTQIVHPTLFSETQAVPAEITTATGNESPVSPTEQASEERLTKDIENLAEVQEMENEARMHEGEAAIPLNNTVESIVEDSPEPAQ